MPKHIAQSALEDKKIASKKKNEESVITTPLQLIKSKIFFFLERPTTRVPIAYHILNLFIIIGSIIISVISTIEYYETEPNFQLVIFWYELLLLVWFSTEYVLRVITCDALKAFNGFFGRLRFMRSFYMMVDAFVIVTTIVTTVLQLKTTYFTVLRTTRFLQVFRILRLDRQKGDLGMMYRVVYTHRKELITCYFVGFIILFGGAYIVFILEKENPASLIDNMANGLYWAVITVTSVGYGDISPSTMAGKMTTGVFALVGCAFFALPSGILGSGFALQVAKQKNKKKFLKIKNPAAIVIQTVWRNYSVSKKKTHLTSTWDLMIPQITGTVKWPGYYVLLPGVKAVCNAKNFDAFNIGLDSEGTPQKRRRTSLKRREHSINESDGTSSEQEQLMMSAVPTIPKGKVNMDRFPRYKAAIRFMLRVKYWTCIRSFKTQRYPYVNLQEIMEKNAQCHIETISYLKNMHDQMQSLRDELHNVKMQIRLGQDLHSDTQSEDNIIDVDVEVLPKKKKYKKQNKDDGSDGSIEEIEVKL